LEKGKKKKGEEGEPTGSIKEGKGGRERKKKKRMGRRRK